VGRVFVARPEEGESVYDVLEEIGRREKIRAASVMAIEGYARRR
jgi:predicted DNA-binding protein with PD1-like motif